MSAKSNTPAAPLPALAPGQAHAGTSLCARREALVSPTLRYRELFLLLALRDIKVRYKHTVLGIVWAIAQPMFAMVVFTMISRVGSLSTDGVRPEVFYFCGMLPVALCQLLPSRHRAHARLRDFTCPPLEKLDRNRRLDPQLTRLRRGGQGVRFQARGRTV